MKSTFAPIAFSRCTFVILLLVGLWPGTSSASEDVPRLRQAFAGVSQASDHIMVVDTSGSMKGYWGAVTGAIADYTDALPDGDHVSIICFDTEAKPRRRSRVW